MVRAYITAVNLPSTLVDKPVHVKRLHSYKVQGDGFRHFRVESSRTAAIIDNTWASTMSADCES